MRTKHRAEALEFTMRWKDGHPSPGRLDIHNSIKTVVSRHWHSGVNWVHWKRFKVSLYVIVYRPSRGSATIHDWVGFTRVFLSNAADGMSALWLRSNTRNAAKSELIEEKLVHLRFKFIARGTRIVVISMLSIHKVSDSKRSLKLFHKPSRKEEQSGLFKSSFSQAWKFKGQSSSGGKSIWAETLGVACAGSPFKWVTNGHCFLVLDPAVPGHDRTEDLDNH